MNDRKFCIVMHVRHHEILELAVSSIERLILPEGHEVEFLSFDETDSTLEGYQACAASSDAKFKVYIKDNVVLLNPNILSDLLTYFQSDARIGMIGVLGAETLTPSTKVVHGYASNSGVVGKKRVISADAEEDLCYGEIRKAYQQVVVVEDSFFATSQDIPWNTVDYKRPFHGCLEQAIAYGREGLKIIVPRQAQPWIAQAALPETEDDEMAFTSDKAVFLRRNAQHFPVVSVLIPTYNRPYWLVDTIDSVLAQTYPSIRVFICDNSRDAATEAMVKEKYLDEHPNIIYERNKENLGLSGSMRRLHEKADTPFVTLVTDDDMLTPICVERQMNYFCLDRGGQISICSGYTGVCDKDKNYLGIFGGMDKQITNDTMAPGHVFADHMLKNNSTLFNVFSGVFRRERLKEPLGTLNGRRGVCNMDRYSAYALLSTGMGVYVSEVLYIGRQHEDQSQRSPLLVIEGGNDYFHEVSSARKYGFLSDHADHEKAWNTVMWYYDNFVLKTAIIGPMDEAEKEAFDRCIANIQSAHTGKFAHA